jgi:hypothetical protein
MSHAKGAQCAPCPPLPSCSARTRWVPASRLPSLLMTRLAIFIQTVNFKPRQAGAAAFTRSPLLVFLKHPVGQAWNLPVHVVQPLQRPFSGAKKHCPRVHVCPALPCLHPQQQHACSSAWHMQVVAGSPTAGRMYQLTVQRWSI